LAADRRLGRLGRSLVLAFVGMALVAEAVVASVTLLADRADVAALGRDQRVHTQEAVVSVLAMEYRTAGGWARADLRPASTLAKAYSAQLTLYGEDGRRLVGPGTVPTDRFRTAGDVVVGGQRVGRAELDFADGVTPSGAGLVAALTRAVALSAALAAVLAALVSVLAARTITRPVKRLSMTARAIAGGDSAARVGEPKGRGELAELSRTFDAMATELQRHEGLRRSMAADVAHELRNPLAVLQGEVESMIDGVQPVTNDALLSLHEEVLRLGHMVEDLQTLASADAAGFQLVRSRVDLAEVVRVTVAGFEGPLRTADISLTTDLTSVAVWADAGRLAQVVSNLLSNALKFTPRGGAVRIWLGLSGPSALLQVADTGPGVPESERPHIWDRFYRGGAARRSTGGSGIGLAVVKNLVEAHGGTVDVVSPAGGGACFLVWLPRA
jgi:two-component system sensor histidine kinase BaeS